MVALRLEAGRAMSKGKRFLQGLVLQHYSHPWVKRHRFVSWKLGTHAHTHTHTCACKHMWMPECSKGSGNILRHDCLWTHLKNSRGHWTHSLLSFVEGLVDFASGLIIITRTFNSDLLMSQDEVTLQRSLWRSWYTYPDLPQNWWIYAPCIDRLSLFAKAR